MKQIYKKKLHTVSIVSLIAFVSSVATVASVGPVIFIAAHLISTMNSKGSITIRAAGRGNPLINLSDGREVSTDYSGAPDADSHWDVVAAARKGDALWMLPGVGRRGFGAARRIELPGRVTTLVTGEINRADGLTDVVVEVVAADGPKALVFVSPVVSKISQL